MKFLKPIWTNELEATILINGVRTYVALELEYDDSGCPEKCNLLDFDQVDTGPLTISKGTYVKWGGWPDFIQGEICPTGDDLVPYFYLCTIYNNWGDSGNTNVFIDLRTKDVYIEASCA